MKKYNHSLDYTVLALASAADGDFAKAGKLLLKASTQHDVQDAVAILEASNAQAFDKLTASRKANPVKATKKVKASTRVRAFDIGDEDEINDLIDDADQDEDDAEHDVDEAENEVDAADEFEEEEDFTEQFAAVLSGMRGASKPKRRK